MKEMSSMKKFVRITALVLCVVTLFALFSTTVFAESAEDTNAPDKTEENKLPTIVVSAIIAGISAIIIGIACAIVSAINKRK
jgi:Na+/proline symporter